MELPLSFAFSGKFSFLKMRGKGTLMVSMNYGYLHTKMQLSYSEKKIIFDVKEGYLKYDKSK